jgi:hypothetical protein
VHQGMSTFGLNVPASCQDRKAGGPPGRAP